MALLSEKLKRVKPSAALVVTQMAREMRARQVDVVSLSAGEPDFDTPDHVKEAAIEAIRRGETKYTTVDGIAELKEAIRGKFQRENGLEYGLDEICVSAGGKHTIYCALAATLDDGDEVVIPAPYWVSYPDMTRLCGGEAVEVECGEGEGFMLTAEALEGALTDRTKWVMLNNPGNPSGCLYDEKRQRELGEVLRGREGVYVLSDEIYESLVYEGDFVSFARACPWLKERTLTMNGASKGYAMTGWRIGYGGGPKELMGGMRKVQGQMTNNPCSISQWATVAALEGDQGFLAGRRESFRERRDYVVGRLNAIDGLRCAMPGGAFYAYPWCGGVIGKRTPGGRVLETDGDFCEALLEEGRVAAVSGGAFGLSPYFRASTASSREELERACDRIEEFCGSLRLWGSVGLWGCGG